MEGVSSLLILIELWYVFFDSGNIIFLLWKFEWSIFFGKSVFYVLEFL